MMLVYHFKDRLSVLENKFDTMYTIVENITKEVNRLHVICSKSVMQEKQFPLRNPFHIQVPQSAFFTNKIVVSDNEEDEDSDYSSDEDSEDSDGIVVTESENVEVLAEIDDSLNIPFELQYVSLNEHDVVEHDLDVNHVVENDVDLDESHVDLDESPIENLIETIPINEENPLLEENESIGQDLDINVYKKMEVSALKSLVLSKGLSMDVKKLKKSELIDLLVLQS